MLRKIIIGYLLAWHVSDETYDVSLEMKMQYYFTSLELYITR